jgi:hypothetical protein
VLLQANSHTANTANGHALRPLPTQHTHVHKNHYTTNGARSNTASHATLATTGPSNYIPKLDINGSNFWKWNAAVLMYTALNDASSILEGKPKPSTLLYTEWIPAPEPVNNLTIDIDDTNVRGKTSVSLNRYTVIHKNIIESHGTLQNLMESHGRF